MKLESANAISEAAKKLDIDIEVRDVFRGSSVELHSGIVGDLPDLIRFIAVACANDPDIAEDMGNLEIQSMGTSYIVY